MAFTLRSPAFDSVRAQYVSTPEPTTLALFGLGLAVRQTDAYLPFVNTQTKATLRIMADPKLEGDIVSLRTIIRQRNEDALITASTRRPLGV